MIEIISVHEKMKLVEYMFLDHMVVKNYLEGLYEVTHLKKSVLPNTYKSWLNSSVL
jgi:hypothetical protein